MRPAAIGPLAAVVAAAGCVGSTPVAPPLASANNAMIAGRPPEASALPPPPASGLPRPSGVPGNLTVLDWAGFKGAVSWTFDDAQPSHIAHYAELNAVGVPMTFYLTTNNETEAGFLDTWQRAVRDGHELGNHSVHHCHAGLTGCTSGRPLASLEAEVDEATSYIVRHTPQKAVWTAASPFGDLGYTEVASTRFFVNRGVPEGTIAPDDADVDPYNLPVHAVTTGETAASFDRVTDDARAGGKWIIFLVHTLTPTNASWYAPVAIGEVTAGMKHARALHDVWTGTLVDVAAYWRGQTLLAEARPTVTGSSTTWTWTLPDHFPSGRLLRVTVDGGTLSQNGRPLPWSPHGYYELALDAGSLTLSP
jgi:peptidoglycan/xylan/chitin deacetylase (PgdA/CDA1 family)